MAIKDPSILDAPDAGTKRGISRLTMLGSMLSGVLIGGVACSSGGSALPRANAAGSGTLAQSDIDVLNFALNLEYLEAEFYSIAVTGKTIEANGASVSGTGTGSSVNTAGGTTGGAKVTFSDSITSGISSEIATDELSHVKLLQSVLGSYAIAKPAINLNALGTQSGTVSNFLALARAFEDTGVSAYGGAAPLVSTAIIQTAAQILAVEAYHAGAIRTLIAQMNVQTTATDGQDVLPPPSGSMYFTTTTNALSIVRSTTAVLSIVKPFFPNGLNGNIH